MPDARHRGGTPRQYARGYWYAIQSFAESQRFSVVRDFTGHGLGQTFHCAPTILHYGLPGAGMREPGMIFTIEPMINAGRHETKNFVRWMDSRDT